MSPWIQVHAIVPPGAYPVLELARSQVFRAKRGLPEHEGVSWGIVLSLLAAEYLASERSCWHQLQNLFPDNTDPISTTELFKVMSSSRSLTPEILANDPERVYRRLETICKQCGINTLEIETKLISPFLDHIAKVNPDAVRMKALQDENEALKEQIKALQRQKDSPLETQEG